MVIKHQIISICDSCILNLTYMYMYICMLSLIDCDAFSVPRLRKTVASLTLQVNKLSNEVEK